MKSSNSIARPSFRAVALVLASFALVLGGCRGERSDKPPRQFFPDLDDQPKYKAQSASTFFADGRAMREPVRGTVPFGSRPYTIAFEGKDFSDRDGFLKADRRVYEGKEPVLDADGSIVMEPGTSTPREVYVERIPVTVDAELLALGEKKYNIYCIVCHSQTGDGKGTVGTRWSYPLPSFHDPKYYRGGEKGQDGYLFHVIRYGVPNEGENAPYPLKMPAYATKVSEREAWAIVAYLRAIQAAHSSPLDAAPERERMDLEKRKPVAPQAEAGAVTGKERAS